jgi:hypothetical protein
MQGWINAGIEDDIADIMGPFGLGEVVAAVNPDLTVYSNRFAAHTIFERIGGLQPNKTYRLILNYDSFIKMAKKVQGMISKQHVAAFNQDMDSWIKTMAPRVFWVNLLVPEKVANHFQELNIGEVITAEGKSTFFDLYKNPPDSELIKWEDLIEEDRMARCCGDWDVFVRGRGQQSRASRM